jgi:proline dehydrogenase
MSLLRNVLLAASNNRWLREHGTQFGFMRRSVRRFMPGEELEAALEAAGRLGAGGISTVITHLGENIADRSQAIEVADHYCTALREIRARGTDAHVSVKPTQLGLDLDWDTTLNNLLAVVRQADSLGNMTWIDMENSPYVDRTMELFRRAREHSPRVGLCLQSYLYRTAADLEALLPMGPAIRLVKGAYNEPADVAFRRRKDVDDNYLRLSARMLDDEARTAGARLAAATHDVELVRKIQQLAPDRDGAVEFQLLYGIRRELQLGMARSGWPVRVLISYGAAWYPWFVRRLAERPANVLFLVRSLFWR